MASPLTRLSGLGLRGLGLTRAPRKGGGVLNGMLTINGSPLYVSGAPILVNANG